MVAKTRIMPHITLLIQLATYIGYLFTSHAHMVSRFRCNLHTKLRHMQPYPVSLARDSLHREFYVAWSHDARGMVVVPRRILCRTRLSYVDGCAWAAGARPVERSARDGRSVRSIGWLGCRIIFCTQGVK
jgi:hypothetical protein